MYAAHRDERGALLADAISAAFEPVAAELRLVDAADFIAYIHQEKLANIHDIVSSSTELFFRPGTLTFGWGAHYELDWSSAPAVSLDMEFRHRSVWLVFKLSLRAQKTDVRIDYFSSGKAAASSEDSARLLLEAIADARLCPFGA